jgi:hypothetical protein
MRYNIGTRWFYGRRTCEGAGLIACRCCGAKIGEQCPNADVDTVPFCEVRVEDFLASPVSESHRAIEHAREVMA